MIRKILTIGYTGYSLDDFVGQLKDHKVECLLDIREIPLSRKRGFSKTALRDRLNASGVAYTHFPKLGSPKVLRHEVRETGDYVRFFRGVRKHLNLAAPTEELQAAIQIARSKRACLMCCCPNWEQCHRRCVVDAILKLSYFSFQHISLMPAHQARRLAA